MSVCQYFALRRNSTKVQCQIKLKLATHGRVQWGAGLFDTLYWAGVKYVLYGGAL